jgi:hypothetical protein
VRRSPREGDERIYRALVDQLEAGRGYTLRGHPLVGQLPVESYGRPLFFHPPGGVLALWAADRLFGRAGFALVELAAYALFFAGALALGRTLLLPERREVGVIVVALVAAFDPIVVHVTSRFWLDGPLCALATAGSALVLAGLRDASRRAEWLGAAALAYATLVKATAVLVLPGLLCCAIAIHGVRTPAVWRAAGRVAIGVVLVQAGWALLQWQASGSPFSGWAGRPAPELVAHNAYVRYVTVGRSPWSYLTLLPTVEWSLVPTLALWLALRGRSEAWRRGGALVCWIAVVVQAHVLLGAIGYSKVLRYVVLLAPAAAVLSGLVVAAAWGRGKAMQLAVMIVSLSFAIGVLQGVKTGLWDQADLILPLTSPAPTRGASPPR